MKVRAVGLPAAALGLFALLAILSAPPATAAPDPCHVTVNLADPVMTAAVTSAQGAKVRSTVIVTFQKPPPLQAVIRLAASTDTGWPLTVEPEIQIVDSGSGTFFEILLQAPAALAPGASGTVRVAAEVTLGGYKCPVAPESAATVVVLPYLDAFSGQIPVGSIDNQGSIGRAEFDILVRVRSNTAVHVAFLFHADPAIDVTAPTSLDFPATFSEVSERTIHVVLRAPGLRPGSHDVNITVHAEGADLPPKDGQLGLTIMVPPGRAPDSFQWGELIPAAGAAAAGAAVVVLWRRHRP